MISAVLVDSRPAYLGTGSSATLLLTQLGTTTLLQHLKAKLGELEVPDCIVVPDFKWSEAYGRAVQKLAPGTVVVPSLRFRETLGSYEPSDCLLIVDTRWHPLDGPDFGALLHDSADHRLVGHLVLLQTSGQGTQELVLCDENDHVRAVQRLYDGVTQLETVGVRASRVPVAATRYFDRLDEIHPQHLRARLAASGIPCRDITTSTVSLDLTTEEGLVELNEVFVRGATKASMPPSYTESAPQIWTDRGCTLHATSRVYGPAILRDRVTIGRDAVVIGPVTVGSGARIERDAFVSQSVISAGVSVSGASPRIRRVLAHEVVNQVAGPVASAAPQRPSLLEWSVDHAMGVHGHNGVGDHTGRRTVHSVIKRLFDFGAALVGLVVLLPVLLFVAALVKLTSRGPVLFGHDREGRGGKVFRCWKFRTMVERAHTQQRALYERNSADGPQFVLPGDPRVTWLGHWLRISNLDELPQLINVIRGEMSLVGPRPSPFRENQICVPWRKARLSVRPGITGLWQVCRRGRTVSDFYQWILFDILYVRHISIWLDLRILLATVLTSGGRWSVPLTWMIPPRKLRGGTLDSPAIRRSCDEEGATLGTGPNTTGESTDSAIEPAVTAATTG